MKRIFHTIALVGSIVSLAGCVGAEADDEIGADEAAGRVDEVAEELGAAAGGAEASLLQPSSTFLPKVTGTCPEFKDGTLTFKPANYPARDVRIWMSDKAKTLDGPLIFYWHGTGSSPTEATYGIGTTELEAIKAQGGIVVAPTHDAAAGTYPWFYVSSTTRDDDFRVADEVLACAIQKVGVDVRRIHSMGMSAGGLNTTQMSYRRSGYIASAVTYSGGRIASIPTQDATNKFAAMIFHGGTKDVVGISFQTASQNYYNDLKSKSQFGMLCNHGKGHSIPTDARAAVWQFLQAHPFGTVPSPYAGGLPASMPSYCAL
jgi:poly(3-hydroxybutyrate) depolymerase